MQVKDKERLSTTTGKANHAQFLESTKQTVEREKKERERELTAGSFSTISNIKSKVQGNHNRNRCFSVNVTGSNIHPSTLGDRGVER